MCGCVSVHVCNVNSKRVPPFPITHHPVPPESTPSLSCFIAPLDPPRRPSSLHPLHAFSPFYVPPIAITTGVCCRLSCFLALSCTLATRACVSPPPFSLCVRVRKQRGSPPSLRSSNTHTHKPPLSALCHLSSCLFVCWVLRLGRFLISVRCRCCSRFSFSKHGTARRFLFELAPRPAPPPPPPGHPPPPLLASRSHSPPARIRRRTRETATQNRNSARVPATTGNQNADAQTHTSAHSHFHL